MNVTPTGFVPNEDTGTIMASVDLPPGTSQDRTEEVMMQFDSLIAANPAVQSRTVISGFSFLGGQGASYGSVMIKLKPWEERSLAQNSSVVSGMLYLQGTRTSSRTHRFSSLRRL